MSRLEHYKIKPKTDGRLIDRTENIVRLYDEEEKSYAFSDSGDAEMYAAEMADLLERWASSYRASVAIHPASWPEQKPDNG